MSKKRTSFDLRELDEDMDIEELERLERLIERKIEPEHVDKNDLYELELEHYDEPRRWGPMTSDDRKFNAMRKLMLSDVPSRNEKRILMERMKKLNKKQNFGSRRSRRRRFGSKKNDELVGEILHNGLINLSLRTKKEKKDAIKALQKVIKYKLHPKVLAIYKQDLKELKNEI